MAIDAVVTEIGFSADKPLRERFLPIEDFFPRFEPMELIRDFPPKFLRIAERFTMEFFVLGEALEVRFF